MCSALKDAGGKVAERYVHDGFKHFDGNQNTTPSGDIRVGIQSLCVDRESKSHCRRDGST